MLAQSGLWRARPSRGKSKARENPRALFSHSVLLTLRKLAFSLRNLFVPKQKRFGTSIANYCPRKTRPFPQIYATSESRTRRYKAETSTPEVKYEN
jgi:hypothetical protein